MPIQLGGPSLPKIKKPKPYNPFAYVPGGASPAVAQAIQTKGYAMPNVAIPNASAFVKPNVIGGSGGGSASTSTDFYGEELAADPMYAIGQKNYQDALDMGQRSVLRDPINQLLLTYGYDPQAYAKGHEGAIPQNALDLANKYIDPAALAAAQKNPYTVANQIGKGFGDALESLPYQLAARGAQNSGAAAIMGSNLDYDRGLKDKQAIDQMLAGIGTANQNWTDFQTGQANTWRQAQETIAARLAQKQGYHGAEDPSTVDYSGGPASAYQPASSVQGLMDRDQGAGQWDSWADAMNGRGSTYAPPAPVYKPAAATAKLIKKMRASGQSSAWETAMRKLGG